MESCLGGSKRNNNKTIKQKYHQQHSQQFYSQQEIEDFQINHQQHQQQQLEKEQLQQQQLKCRQVSPNERITTTTKPKFVNNCLQFPPPPNYPPPILNKTTTIPTTATTTITTTTETATQRLNMAGRSVKTTVTANNQQQQQQQQIQLQPLKQQPQLHTPPSPTTIATTAQQAQPQQHQPHQQQQHLNLQLQQHVQTTIHSLQQQINNLHIEMDASRDVGGNRNLTMPHHLHHAHAHSHPHSHHHHQSQHHQQHHYHHGGGGGGPILNSSLSPTSSSSSTSTSINSANTLGISPCGRRSHVLPRYPDPDPDAIEICNEPQEAFTKTNLTRRQHQQLQQQQQRQMALEAESLHWPATPHSSHDYSYAYYEPGVAMRHSNIPAAISPSLSPLGQNPPPPPPNSMRALLSKGKKNKSLVSAATRHCYQTRYGLRNAECNDLHALHTLPNNMLLLHENFYEEISGTNEPRAPLRVNGANSHSAGSLSQSLVEEELRRVQSRHRKVLGELNLSVEAMLMPESPTPSAGGGIEDLFGEATIREQPTVSVTTSSGQPGMVGGVRLSASSADNICASSSTQISEELPNSSQLGFCAADLDSGFSGSSGASYIGSLRLHKTNAALSQLKNEKRQIATANGNSLKRMEQCTNTMCPFPYATQSCRSFQRGAHTQLTMNASGGGASCRLEEDEIQESGFLTRASCGRRILNCAKLRAAEDPGPVAPPTESKARSFWNRKGWRKLPGFSTSTSSINDTGLTGRFKFLLKRTTSYRKT